VPHLATFICIFSLIYSRRRLIGSLWARPCLIPISEWYHLPNYLFQRSSQLSSWWDWLKVPKSDSIIRLIPLSVIPLSGTHCNTVANKLLTSSQYMVPGFKPMTSWSWATRPAVLKPGVATHFCVAKILGCVHKWFLNLWTIQKPSIAAVTKNRFLLSVFLCSKVIRYCTFL
jgi:hypothetical protein